MKIPRPDIVDWVRALMDRANIKADRTLWIEVRSHYDILLKLSIADIFLVPQAKRDGHTPLLTFDRKLAKQMLSA